MNSSNFYSPPPGSSTTPCAVCGWQLVNIVDACPQCLTNFHPRRAQDDDGFDQMLRRERQVKIMSDGDMTAFLDWIKEETDDPYPK